jgi:hypothetical protein
MFRLQIIHLQAYFCHLSHKMLCTLWDHIVFTSMEYIKLNHLSQSVWCANLHVTQTSMPPAGFEPTVSAGERPKTYVSDRAATGVVLCFVLSLLKCYVLRKMKYLINSALQASKPYALNTPCTASLVRSCSYRLYWPCFSLRLILHRGEWWL